MKGWGHDARGKRIRCGCWYEYPYRYCHEASRPDDCALIKARERFALHTI